MAADGTNIRAPRWAWALAASALLATGVGGFWYWQRPAWPAGDPALAAYVQGAPPWPVVFTSRTEPASLRAAADEGEGFTYPGQPLWQAREGRLRLLTPRGEVAELTWGRRLPDGSTLIDVISPSVSPDGTKIVFAGRKGPPDPGHFRLYEINVDGTGLRQLTGGPDDPGCTAVPPMRYAEDGRTLLSDEGRRRVDYDDLDPVYAPGGHIVFVSSRTPDLGRDHARRSTTLWIMRADGSDKKPLSANRNNDRWPWIASNGYVLFSLWSRNREVVAEDCRSIEPYRPGRASATRPTDSWLGAHVEPNGDFFGGLLKTPQPVWRPRQLLSGQYAFMTSFEAAADSESGRAGDPLATLTVAQAPGGTILHSPSSLAADSALPRTARSPLVRGPQTDARGRPLRLACPSPGPPDKLLLAAAAADGEGRWSDGRYGLYLADDHWIPGKDGTVSAEDIGLTPLFDDPAFVDAEPAAVYPREIPYRYTPLEHGDGAAEFELADGRLYSGPTGEVHNSDIYFQRNDETPGQRSDSGQAPIYSAPPNGSIETIRVYASHRDRFDDPQDPRIEGSWELLLEAPVENGDFRFRLPCGPPTVLAGFDAEGRVARWTGAARDAQGNRASFFALAGDHYSGARAGFPHFCVGCHAGHSGTPTLHSPARRGE